MKALIVIIALLNLHFICKAQEDEDVKAFTSRMGWQQGDTNFWKKVTINQVLGLPAVYKVISFDITFENRGEIYVEPYSIIDTTWYKRFDTNLPIMVSGFLKTYILNGKKGDEFIVDNLWVRKDGKTFKLKSKAITIK